MHKPGKVVTEVGRRNVYAVTSGEKGKTHTLLSCVSASGLVVPPMMIFPRKQSVPDKFREGAVANTLFVTSKNGWINTTLFLQWFQFFLRNIPPIRPVLLTMDGHSSHISIEVIQLARDNDIHFLCLPAHTTHILQPLDVGVFKSFKSNFSKACTKFLAAHPGRVVTSDKLSLLVAEAWPHSSTALNILSGFKKCGIFPFNPSEISDRQLAPSKAVTKHRETEAAADTTPASSLFSLEKEELYKKRYEEGYNVNDPDYIAWLKLYHPTSVSSIYSGSSSSAIECLLFEPRLLLSQPLVWVIFYVCQMQLAQKRENASLL